MKGWHKESYRHYLAAKGIKTNRYSATKAGVKLRPRYEKALQMSMVELDNPVLARELAWNSRKKRGFTRVSGWKVLNLPDFLTAVDNLNSDDPNISVEAEFALKQAYDDDFFMDNADVSTISKMKGIAKKYGFDDKKYYAIKRKSLTPEEFNKMLEKETTKGAFSRAEITLAKAPGGKKAKLLEEQEWRREAITQLGYDPDRPIENVGRDNVPDFVWTHYEVLDNVNEQLKRIQSNPAYQKIRGKTSIQLKEGLVEAHAGTSQKKSQKLKIILEGYDLNKPINPLESKAREIRVAKRNLETATIRRVEPILVEQAESAAFEGKRTPQIKLKDVAKTEGRGRPRKYLAKITKKAHDWVEVNKKYEIALKSDKMINVKDYKKEIRFIRKLSVPALKVKYKSRFELK